MQGEARCVLCRMRTYGIKHCTVPDLGTKQGALPRDHQRHVMQLCVFEHTYLEAQIIQHSHADGPGHVKSHPNTC